MIKHIVFFRFKGEPDREERLKMAMGMKSIFSPLVELPSAREYTVGINIAESEAAWDVVIDSTFDSVEKLKQYSVSKEHQDAILEAKKFDKERSVVDYEC